MLNNYLNELFGRKKKNPEDEYEYVYVNDKSLPNPYNFRRIKLDPKITKADIEKGQKAWLDVLKYHPKESKDFSSMLRSDSNFYTITPFVIKDGNKRVGIVIGEHSKISISNWKEGRFFILEAQYVTWVRGKNYATQGIMALTNHPMYPTVRLQLRIYVHYKNKPSLKVVKNLKMVNDGELWLAESPFWWNGGKYIKHKK